jgi:hypothetical protein
MILLQNKALAAPHACPCMWFEMLKGHPMMYHGACMVRLTRLPPSKHVLMLSTPLILKKINKIRAINELEYKFRGVFKALKTNVSRKYFQLLLCWSHRYCLLSLVESKLFSA